MNLDAALEQLSRDPDAPLDVAAIGLWLARDEYPTLDVEAVLGEIAALAHEARSYVRGSFAARVQGLCRYLFHELGFHGNVKNYYDPRNSYLNQVLERRTGIPITLAAITMAIGQRTGLDIVGVGLPGHFIAKAVGPEQEILIDCFHGGRILTPVDCEHLVRQVTGLPFEAHPLNLQPLPLGLMVTRMLNNLKGIYLGQEDFPRAVRILERLRQLNPHDAVVRRDLGTTLLKLDQPGRAIDHLRHYLAVAEEADDAATIRKLLTQAERQVARWN